MNVRDASYVRAGNYEGEASVDPHPPETFDDGFPRTAPIGSLAPNDFGLHDVHGNLWEWCLDEYQSNFYSKSPLMDPVCEPRGTHPRVCRGGNFRYTIAFSRSAFRGAHAPRIRGWLGVRPARAVAP